jgi:hypothetical protein
VEILTSLLGREPLNITFYSQIDKLRQLKKAIAEKEAREKGLKCEKAEVFIYQQVYTAPDPDPVYWVEL